MKKIFLAILCVLTFNLTVWAATTTTSTTNWNSAAAVQRVNTIGTKLIKANGIGQAITFKVSDQADINWLLKLKTEHNKF